MTALEALATGFFVTAGYLLATTLYQLGVAQFQLWIIRKNFGPIEERVQQGPKCTRCLVHNTDGTSIYCDQCKEASNEG